MTMLAAIYLGSPYDSILAPYRPGAGRVEIPSRFSLLEFLSQATLSRELHTRRLLLTHVPVGYRQQYVGLKVNKFISFNSYLSDFTSHLTFKLRRAVFRVGLHRFVYARHGRELMGLKSPVSVPVLN